VSPSQHCHRYFRADRHTKEHRVETNHNFLHTAGQPVSDRMRELLARAAQDHVYEQRSQGQILDEIRQRLEGMEWLLREVRERELNGLTGALESVRGQVDELTGRPPEWAEGLAEHIEAVGERVKPVAELPALWADVGVVAENVDEGLSRLQAVIESAQQITHVTQQATDHMGEMAKRLDKLQSSMEAAAVRFNRLDKSLAEMGHRAEKLEYSINGVSTRVDHALDDMAERVEQGMQSVSGRLEGVGGRLDGLDGRLEGLSGRIEGVDDRVESTGARIDHLPAALQIGELQRRVAELANRPYLDYSDRFDALEKQLGDAVDPLVEEVRARPDRDEVEEAISRVVASAYDDVVRRLDEFATGLDTINDDLRGRVEGIQTDVVKQIDEALRAYTKRIDSIQDALAQRVTGAHAEVTRQVGEVRDDVANTIKGVSESVARRINALHEDVWKRVDGVHEELSRRASSIQDEVGKKVDDVHEDVGKQMSAVYEDVLKRLGTLEETMLALAEALLRPRRDGKD
jgi:chromosome segregation ATPase